MPNAILKAVEYFLPERVLGNDELSRDFPDWPAGKIADKTGINTRHIVSNTECSSDLAVGAAQNLFQSGVCKPEEVDFLLLCTQSPDYTLPTTACLVQDRLGLSTQCGALDFNLGCSGFIYGLGLAKGLIESGQAANVLLLTAETYSKYIHPQDKSTRTIFGDAAAATLITAANKSQADIGPFVYGTDGKGARNLIVPTGGARQAFDPSASAQADASGSIRSINNLFMNGPEIFNFTLQAVPASVNALLAKTASTLDDFDFIIFHQANRFMLETLRRKLRIPEAKFPILMDDVGNTVSSTIPIVLSRLAKTNRLQPGMRLMVVGFGVGYSWSAAQIMWS